MPAAMASTTCPAAEHQRARAIETPRIPSGPAAGMAAANSGSRDQQHEETGAIKRCSDGNAFTISGKEARQ